MKVTKNLFNLAEDYKFIGTIYLYLQIVFSVKIWSQVCYKALDILELTTANIFLPFIRKPSFLLAFSFPFLPCICNSGFPPPKKKLENGWSTYCMVKWTSNPQFHVP